MTQLPIRQIAADVCVAPQLAPEAMAELAARLSMPASVCYDIAELKASILALVQPGDQIVIMSNGAFGGIHQQLLEALS
jgi:UDP-N-acetylmuramate: L-alanyl-gamma-D-glutamyl-meso-diaminopimelate ligase